MNPMHLTITIAAIVFAVANACVPRDSGNPAAATRTKKMGKTAVSTTAWSEDTAQSYIAQARSSFRPKPSRSSHVDFAIIASLTRPLRSKCPCLPSESVDAHAGLSRLRA